MLLVTAYHCQLTPVSACAGVQTDVVIDASGAVMEATPDMVCACTRASCGSLHRIHPSYRARLWVRRSHFPVRCLLPAMISLQR